MGLVNCGDLGFGPGAERGVEIAPKARALSERWVNRQRARVAAEEGFEFSAGDHAPAGAVFHHEVDCGWTGPVGS